jgi:BRCA1-associated protein
MTIDGFLQFIEATIPKLRLIRFIQDISINANNEKIIFNQVLLYFEDQDSADNFYYDYNTKSFPGNKSEYLYSVFINHVDILNEEKLADNDLLISKSELTCCPLCLEKLDENSSGIHTIPNSHNVDRWEIYRKNCKVCMKYQQTENKCSKCDISTYVWCCLICGFIGCDRYQKNAHGKDHFETTLHRYSIDLTTYRIWDYLGDSWVHRILKVNNTDNSTIYLESQDNTSNINSKEYLTRIENIISEYNYALTTQLEEQRNYYEKEISVLKDNQDKILTEEYSKLNQLKEALKIKKANIEASKRMIKEYSKKYNQLEKKIKEVKESIELTKEISNNINSDIKKQAEPSAVVL